MAIVWNNFTYDNKYVVDAINGDDVSGDGVTKPFKTLSKLLQVIPKDKNSLIKLEDGEYTFGRDISDGFSNCRVTILGNKARTTLKQIVGLYSGNNTGGSYTFTLEFIQLLFTMDAALTKYNLNNFGFHWKMYNVVIVNIPSNDYSVFLPGGGSLKLYNCINISLTRNLLRNDWGIIELTNCYGAFTSGYNTNNSSWDKSNNIITSAPVYDSEYKTPYDGIGVYFGEFAWRKEKFLFKTDKGQLLSFENKIDRLTAIPKMTSNTTPSGRAFAKDIYSTINDAWYAFNQIDDQGGYASKAGSGGVGYLGYEFDEAIVIRKYAVRSSIGAGNLVTLPKDWTFEGSNDGVKWHVLDTQKNQTWSTELSNKEYLIDKPQKYKMYRLNWIANNGYSYTIINELKMYANELNKVTQIPSIDFTEYGMDEITQGILKYDYDQVRLISNKESNVNEGRLFEHEIDLKKYEVNKISLANIEGKSLLQSKDGLYHSILDTVGIKYIPNADEQNFINHGMGKSSAIDFEAEFTQKSFIKTESSVLGDGKVFKQKIDTSKIPIKKVSIK